MKKTFHNTILFLDSKIKQSQKIHNILAKSMPNGVYSSIFRVEIWNFKKFIDVKISFWPFLIGTCEETQNNKQSFRQKELDIDQIYTYSNAMSLAVNVETKMGSQSNPSMISNNATRMRNRRKDKIGNKACKPWCVIF
jgi:hypothetical protein